MHGKAFGSVPRPAAPPPEPAFASLSFPKDRSVLQVFEVAARLRVSEQHVVNLILEGRLRAIDVAGPGSRKRRHYRIPVEAWENYLREQLV